MNKGGTALLTPFADESRQRASLVSGEFKEEAMSKELAKTYDPNGIEDRLYQKWLDKKYFHAEVDHSKTPFTIVIPPQISQDSSTWDMHWTTPCRIS